MVVEKPKNRIEGSAALAPERKQVPKRKVQNPERKRAEREALKQEKRNKILGFLKLNGSVLAAGVIAIAILSRYSAIYENQKTLNELQVEIKTLEESSEDLSIKLMKFNNIVYIEEVATDKLGMVEASSINAIYSDLKNEEFINPEKEVVGEDISFFSKVRSLLFK